MAGKRRIRAMLIDLSGTLHIDDTPTPNAVSALQRLTNHPDVVTVRFVTNTTKESKDSLLNRLHNIGFTSICKEDIYSSLTAAVQYVKCHSLNPYYFLTEDAYKDFSDIPTSDEKNAVVVGLAPDLFTYDNMNVAFRILLNKSHPLIAIHEGKYYKRGDGLALGPGCFTKGLEFSTGTNAIIIGKPTPYFFEAAIPPGFNADECCMIGDDANDDIAGALRIGMRGILVKTGKYIEGIENTIEPFKPTVTLNNFSEAVDFLEENNFEI